MGEGRGTEIFVLIVNTHCSNWMICNGIIGTDRRIDAARAIGKKRCCVAAEVVLVYVADTQE